MKWDFDSFALSVSSAIFPAKSFSMSLTYFLSDVPS